MKNARKFAMLERKSDATARDIARQQARKAKQATRSVPGRLASMMKAGLGTSQSGSRSAWFAATSECGVTWLGVSRMTLPEGSAK